MKKLYTFLLLLIPVLSFGQSVITLNPRNHAPQPIENIQKTTSCVDAILYPQSKMTGVPEIDTMDVATYIGGTSQAFHFSGSGIIHGIRTYMLLDVDGIAGNAAPVSVLISVYNIDADNYPTSLIAQDTVMLMDVGFTTQDLNFNTPVLVSDSFAVAVEIDPTAPSNPYYVTNVSASNDGQGEKLSCVSYIGAWYNAYIDFLGWDMDILIAPNFEQDITTSYTVDVDTVCLGNPVTFTNTTMANTDSMFFADPYSFNLDLNEMLAIATLDTNYSHTYSSAGTYQPTLEMVHYGYEGDCIDTVSMTVTVLDTATANYNYAHMGAGVYQFTDMSANANTYYWDFGDGDTSSLQNPVHTFLVSNNYNVCLTVTDSNGCNVNTTCQTISFVTGVQEKDVITSVNVFPVPANKFFKVQVPAQYKQGTIILTDIVGKNIKRINIGNEEEIKVLTNEINSGVYFVTIESKGQKVFTKRIIIDKK